MGSRFSFSAILLSVSGIKLLKPMKYPVLYCKYIQIFLDKDINKAEMQLLVLYFCLDIWIILICITVPIFY